MNFKLKKIHLFVILLIALIGCCIQMPHFNLGFNLGFNEGFTNDNVDKTQDVYLDTVDITVDLKEDDDVNRLEDGIYRAYTTGTTRAGTSTTGASGMRVIFEIEADDTDSDKSTITSLRVHSDGSNGSNGSDYEQGDIISVDLSDSDKLEKEDDDGNFKDITGAKGKFTFELKDTTSNDSGNNSDTNPDSGGNYSQGNSSSSSNTTHNGDTSFHRDGNVNPLILFNTMVNGESKSSSVDKDEDEEVQGNAQFTMQNRDLIGSPINLSESSPSRSVSVKNKNKNKNPFSQLFDGLANIFGGKKEGMENEDKPAYPGKEGEEDQWILKSKIVPPVCPKCPESSCDTKKCPPCPSCARCPEPAFECKKVPNYRSTNDNYLPRPVLADFSQFGM